jgi:hypothetical protein
MVWECYKCGGPCSKCETVYPERITTVSPCGCVGEPGEAICGPASKNPQAEGRSAEE